MAKFAQTTAPLATPVSPVARKRMGRPPKNATQTTGAVETAPIELSAKTRHTVDDIRAKFLAFSAQTGAWLKSKSELAPGFVKALNAWKQETELGMLDLCRYLDPTIPQNRDGVGYRKHPSYIAAQNLLQLYRRENRDKLAKENGTASATKPSTPMDATARLIKSILPLIPADQVERMWKLIESELHWTDRQRASLENRVKEEDPLIVLNPPRGSGGIVPQLRIAAPKHGNHTAEQEESAA